jgi:hypothetical protein
MHFVVTELIICGLDHAVLLTNVKWKCVSAVLGIRAFRTCQTDLFCFSIE